MRSLPALLILLLSGVPLHASASDSYVIEQFSKELVFHEDGTWTAEQDATVRIGSDAAVRQFGTLSFTFNAGSQTVDLIYVRVRKPNGKVIATPAGDAREISADVSREAPLYSDAREKQLPVRSLEAGDVLEYRVRFSQFEAEAAGQFWYSQRFLNDKAVLKEQLAITIPQNKYVRVESSVAAEVTIDHDQKIYRWQRTPAASAPPPTVQITTFENWQKLGAWYANLFQSQALVTRGIRAKAEELTRGLTTAEQKQHAIYNYVSTRFRYVAVALGKGKYQPHTAEQVLANQYGDCKDKHTLLAALLKAAGIEAWPALVGAATDSDDSFPSPAKFDHVVTVVRNGTDQIWLDSTPEVAPFGLLQPELRGTKALLLPDGSPAQLVTVPSEPPFEGRQELVSDASLSEDGTLRAHMQLTLRGDDELPVRNAFHRAPAAKWPNLVQGLLGNMGFDGAVTSVQVSAPDDLDQPFQVGFDYEHKNYSDWANLRIAQPLLPFIFPIDENDPKPTRAFRIGLGGELVHRATIHLPAGLSAALPQSVHVESAFASYSASYSESADGLTAERQVVIKQPLLAPEEWDLYLSFLHDVKQGESALTQLSESGTEQAKSLIDAAGAALSHGDASTAREQLNEAERLSPKQAHLWSTYAQLCRGEGDMKGALAAQRRELVNRPNSVVAKLGLADLLLHSENNLEALQILERLATESDDPAVLNNAAYLLAQTRADLTKAVTYAQRALELLHAQMNEVKLATLTDQNLHDVETLASIWDTLGFAFLQSGSRADARRYLEASWNLAQNQAAAEHLRQLRPVNPDAMQYSRQDLLQRRTVEFKQTGMTGTADFFLLFSQNQAIEAQFIRGNDCLKQLQPSLLGLEFPALMRGMAPERIARRAILTCSPGNCKVTLLLPAAATK